MTKKCLLTLYVLLSLLVVPAWVSAEVLRDQPVHLVNLNDTSTAESDESIHQDEESLSVFTGSVSETYNLSADPTYGLKAPLKKAKAKMKVLTCHVTTSATDTMRTTFPWVETGIRVAHIAYFEIENMSDFVKFKITLQGPEFSSPLVVETLTFGPQEPSNQWGIGYWRTYSVPGLYKIKMTASPETNRVSGRSSVECSFRVSAPQNN